MAWIGSARGTVTLVTLLPAPKFNASHPNMLKAIITLCWPNLVLQNVSNIAGARGSAAARAHMGPVHAIVEYGGRLWTSGGDADMCSVREWTISGQAVVWHDVTHLGASPADDFFHCLSLGILGWWRMGRSLGEGGKGFFFLPSGRRGGGFHTCIQRA